MKVYLLFQKKNNETTNNQANKECERDNVGEYDWVRINRSEVNIYPAYKCNLHKIEFPMVFANPTLNSPAEG